ncbi:riboflavin kinase / FAD synthase family protein, putative [Plasmodium ovale]|uniref:riboflavin kinase n=2 Tax=Plasmodium ovale TaxID=36330 RepID=A0A1A8WQX5_PLAOA|nr:riboflavin kinase / FAD synthase family protein, putative [Plasmodium ovale curtisi]SCP04913.1 riboflavin kinase / FAD synthase family protein, putative [Plasmodium ovale]
MDSGKQEKNIAFIDADYYIINYQSTITTYIQNICNSLLRDGKHATSDVTIMEGYKENGCCGDYQNDNKRRKIICVFMLRIFLSNIEKNLNLFDLLHDVISKYHYLTKSEKRLDMYCRGMEENGEGEKNHKTSNHFGICRGNGKGDNERKNMHALEKDIFNGQEGNPNAEFCKLVETGKGCDHAENRNKNVGICNGCSIRNEESHRVHDLTSSDEYVNISNVAASRVCFLNLTNTNPYVSSSSESISEYAQTTKDSYGSECNDTLNWENNSKSDEDDYENEVHVESVSDTVSQSAYNSSNVIQTHMPDSFSNESPYSNTHGDSSTCNTLQSNHPPPSCTNRNSFLINYNNVRLRRNSFDNLVNVRTFMNAEKKIYDHGSYKEIENLYRIIILSKLHIGVYNFLTFLKKKNFYFIFYSSNKKLTHFLFKQFKISNNFKQSYIIINSFQELKPFSKYYNFFIFSNRHCFANHARRNGYFRIATGLKHVYGLSSNCDDVNWNGFPLGSTYLEDSNMCVIHPSSIASYEKNTLPDFSDYVPNKYNDVVYPFAKNCNLTKDILSWKIFYIFHKYIYIYGKVVKGYGRGSKYMNIPTANIFNPKLISADIMPGIYFGISKMRGRIYKTVLSVGYNPYFQNKHITIESFLYYKTDNLFYNENIHIIIIGILRSESNFSQFSHLIQAIQFDCELARIIIKKMEHDKHFVTCKNVLASLQ